MSRNIIYISKKPECVEATYFTKDLILPWLQEYHGVTLEEIASLDDTKSGYPIFDKVGLPMTVANASDEVKKLVWNNDGFVSDYETYEGSLDCYGEAKKRGAKLMVFDRDGCIWKGGEIMMPWRNGELPCGQDFAATVQESGYNENPEITILTASSLTQNEKFRILYGLDRRLKRNIYVNKRPKILLVENGSIHVDVLNGETTPYYADLESKFIHEFIHEYKPMALEKVRTVLAKFGINETDNYNGSQNGECYIDPKKQALTINIMRKWTEKGIYENFRTHPRSNELREALFDILTSTAEDTNLPWEEL